MEKEKIPNIEQKSKTKFLKFIVQNFQYLQTKYTIDIIVNNLTKNELKKLYCKIWAVMIDKWVKNNKTKPRTKKLDNSKKW